ncbi:MAG TPA: diiron oxygenase [Acidimicrobiales bacterium]|nr:diiron oxygenase [Acidimicrobiales bacterium]
MSLALDEEQSDDNYRTLVERLSRQSVEKHFDAYADVDWDAPEMRIDPTDPRWEVLADDPLGSTEWYRSLPQDERARIGLHRVATAMKTGAQFESILKRGLLDYASALPNGSPEFRYIYHEVIEEAQHSLMFQEFVNRSGYDPRGLPWYLRLGSRFVVLTSRLFPPLFFLFVLGGEDPIDHTQRRALRSGAESHPLLERIMRIHVTEEARHLSFARHYLKRTVPTLGPVRRLILSIAAPRLLWVMSRAMLMPSPGLLRQHGLPKGTLRRQVDRAEAQQYVKDSVAKVRRLCVELGLVTRVSKPIWKVSGLWDEPAREASR